MYLVALCDDEQAELDKMRALLEKYSAEHPKRELSVECFENAETFLGRIREEVYEPDLILLDIFMNGKTGIEAAREFRGMGVKSRIAFLTSSTDYALEAFEVDAVQYLVKPVSEMSIFDFLDKVFESIEQERKRYVLLKVDNTVRRIMVNSVVCCESQRKNQYLHFSDGTSLCLHMTMAGLEKLFAPFPEIMRLGSSYIINLEHVDILNAHELRMDDGRVIYMPRGSWQNVREKYFDYYCGGEEELF